MHRPNLFIVGASKTATTALHAYLQSHPQVFMCSPKEPGYFCKDFNEQRYTFHKIPVYYANKKNYLSLFNTKEEFTYYGDATPTYLSSSLAAKKIYEFNPQAKIIIGIRYIPDLLFSLHKEHLFNQNETEVSFQKALDLEPERRKGKNLLSSVLYPAKLFYSQEIDFTKNIKRFLQYFPAEQIHVMVFEQFVKNPEQEYRKILEFLDLQLVLPKSFVTVNEKKERRFPLLTRFLASPHGRVKKLLRKILTEKLQQKILLRLKKIDYRFNARKRNEHLPPHLKKNLHEKYEKETHRLNKLLHDNGLIEVDLLDLWSYR
jgi:hypothetical protein